MINQVLSISQMQELQGLDIDTSKASMIWYPKMAIDSRTGKGYVESHYLMINHINSESFWNTREGRETIPTFTLQDILELLPDCIKVNDYNRILMIIPQDNKEVILEYDTIKQFYGGWLEAAFNMLKWCKQNNYI